MTSLPRTVIDIARTNDFEPSVCVADSAFNRDAAAHNATLVRLKDMRDWQGSRNAADAIWREKRREDQMRQLGLEVVRIIWPDLDRPSVVKDKFLQAFQRFKSRGSH